jgi:FkbM family methyltransferase
VAFLNGPVRVLLPRHKRVSLGRIILDPASGDNQLDPQSNGEHLLLTEVAKRLKEAAADAAVVVFDVGANVGLWTRDAAPLLSDGAIIYSFEPTPLTYSRLCDNLRTLDPRVKVVTVNAGLGDADGTEEIFDAGDASTNNSLYERAIRTDTTAARVPVRIMRGDHFCRENRVPCIDFLKIDVEGHEFAVLQGFEPLLTHGRIGCLQFEYGGTWVDSRHFLLDAFRLLQPLGYTLAKIHPEGLELLEQYDHKLETFQFANFVAFRPEWQSAFTTIQ